MSFHDFPKETISRKGRIDWWIDNIQSSSPEQSPASPEVSPPSQSQAHPRRYNTRKRRAEQTEPPPPKRRISSQRRVLVVTSGNPMPKDKNAGGSKGGHPHRDPVKLAPSDTGRGRHLADGDMSPPLGSRLDEVSLEDPAPALPKTVGSTNTGSSRARSKSPTKNFFDWKYADWPVERLVLDGQTAEEAGGFLAKYRSLRSASEGDGVIPRSLKLEQDSIEQIVHKNDHPKVKCYAQNDDTEWQRKVLEKVIQIRQAALTCDLDNSNESSWNARVHGPLLELVVENPKYGRAISCQNVTTARICPRSLASKQANGDDWESKMVDFAISLKPDQKMRDRIKRTFDTLPSEAQWLNQTDFGTTKDTPIFINVETKIPFTGGQKADLQLTGWADAGDTKLDQLLEANGKCDVKIPTTPLLSFYGHDVYLSGWHVHDTGTRLLGKFRLGSTESILGIFQILKGLDILVAWGNKEYRQWYLKNVLKP